MVYRILKFVFTHYVYCTPTPNKLILRSKTNIQAHLERLTHSWQRKNPNKSLNKYTIMSEVAWYALEEVLKNPDTVKNGFRSAG